MKRISMPDGKEKTFTCDIHGEYQGVALTYGGKERKPPCPVCFDEHKNRLEGSAMKENLSRLKKIVENSGIPVELMGVKLVSYKPQCPCSKAVFNSLCDYVKAFEFTCIGGDDRWFQTTKSPRSIVFLGNNGTGKTHLACSVAQALLFLRKINTLLYTTAYDLSLMIKNSWFRESAKTEMQVTRELVDIDFMVIDEVGVQFGTDTDMLLFFQVFNKRLSAAKPTILISNMNIGEMEDMFDRRVIDRLKESETFLFDWESYRGKQHC